MHRSGSVSAPSPVRTQQPRSSGSWCTGFKASKQPANLARTVAVRPARHVARVGAQTPRHLAHRRSVRCYGLASPTLVLRLPTCSCTYVGLRHGVPATYVLFRGCTEQSPFACSKYRQAFGSWRDSRGPCTGCQRYELERLQRDVQSHFRPPHGCGRHDRYRLAPSARPGPRSGARPRRPAEPLGHDRQPRRDAALARRDEEARRRPAQEAAERAAQRPACADCGQKFTEDRWKAGIAVDWGCGDSHPHLRPGGGAVCVATVTPDIHSPFTDEFRAPPRSVLP